MDGWNRLAFDRAAPISPFHLPLRAAWSPPKQTGLVPGRGQFRKRLPRSAQLPLSDNDFSGSQQPTPTSNQAWARTCGPAAMGKLQSTEPTRRDSETIRRARTPRPCPSKRQGMNARHACPNMAINFDEPFPPACGRIYKDSTLYPTSSACRRSAYYRRERERSCRARWIRRRYRNDLRVDRDGPNQRKD